MQQPHKGSALLKLIRPQEVWHPLGPLKSHRDPGKYHTINLAEVTRTSGACHISHLFYRNQPETFYTMNGHEHCAINSTRETFLFKHSVIMLNSGCWKDLRRS